MRLIREGVNVCKTSDIDKPENRRLLCMCCTEGDAEYVMSLYRDAIYLSALEMIQDGDWEDALETAKELRSRADTIEKLCQPFIVQENLDLIEDINAETGRHI